MSPVRVAALTSHKALLAGGVFRSQLHLADGGDGHQSQSPISGRGVSEMSHVVLCVAVVQVTKPY